MNREQKNVMTLMVSSYQKQGAIKTIKKALSYLWHATGRHTYPIQHLLTYPAVWLRRKADHPFLKKLINNKKVLILGSGSSAADLGPIPSDVLVFTCNRGLKYFEHKPLGRPIDIYMSTASKIQRMPEISELLREAKTRFLVIDDLAYARKEEKLAGVYEQLIRDDGKHNDYLKQLIKPHKPKDIRGGSFHPWTSTGIRLLQYALLFGAKEVYLAGIDFGEKGYFWGKNEDKWLHHDIDARFLEIAAKTYPYIYSASKSSHSSKIIPYKPL